jgi:hypothetical protein
VQSEFARALSTHPGGHDRQRMQDKFGESSASGHMLVHGLGDYAAAIDTWRKSLLAQAAGDEAGTAAWMGIMTSPAAGRSARALEHQTRGLEVWTRLKNAASGHRALLHRQLHALQRNYPRALGSPEGARPRRSLTDDPKRSEAGQARDPGGGAISRRGSQTSRCRMRAACASREDGDDR